MAITAGSNLNSATASQQQTLASNYIDFNQDMGWAQQYLPDLMEKEAEVFGPRTVSGFLSQVGAEEAMSADQVVWSEQSRLHLSYVGTIATAGDTNGTFTVVTDIDGNALTTTHGVRVNDIVLIASAGKVSKALVVETPSGSNNGDIISVEPYDAETLTGHSTTASAATLLVIGSEYGKGQSYSDETGTYKTESRGANEPTFKSFNNKPIIMKDYYEISGAEVSQVGWVEVTSEAGGSGYMWYLKAEGETRARFTDYLEMAMLESEKANALSAIGFGADGQTRGAADAGLNGAGTEVLFAAIED